MGWPGGKAGAGVLERLILMMPEHELYVEPFLGGGALLLGKRPARWTFGCDLDASAVAGVRSCIAGYGGGGPSRCLLCVADALPILEGASWGPRVLVYADPPYPSWVIGGRSPYRFGFDEGGHARLLRALRVCGARVMVSSYWSSFYADELRGWWVREFSGMTRGGPRTEVVWCNFRPLDSGRYLDSVGGNFREREVTSRLRRRWVRRYLAMSPGLRSALLRDLQACGFDGDGF